MKPIYFLLSILILTTLACQMEVSRPTPSAEILPTDAPTQLPTVEILPTDTPPWTATVKMAQINVREEPDGETVVGYLKAGYEVTIVRCVDNWCKIENPYGWVFKGCLTIESNLGCEAK